MNICGHVILIYPPVVAFHELGQKMVPYHLSSTSSLSFNGAKRPAEGHMLTRVHHMIQLMMGLVSLSLFFMYHACFVICSKPQRPVPLALRLPDDPSRNSLYDTALSFVNT